MYRELNECMLSTDCLKPYDMKTYSSEKYVNVFSAKICEKSKIFISKCTFNINLTKKQNFSGINGYLLCVPHHSCLGCCQLSHSLEKIPTFILNTNLSLFALCQMLQEKQPPRLYTLNSSTSLPLHISSCQLHKEELFLV